MTWINQLINDADDSKWFMQFVLKKNFFIIDDSGKKSVQLSMIKTVEGWFAYYTSESALRMPVRWALFMLFPVRTLSALPSDNHCV